MKVVKRGKWYVITGMPYFFVDGEGPYTESDEYDVKADAVSDMEGMEKTILKMEPRQTIKKSSPSND